MVHLDTLNCGMKDDDIEEELRGTVEVSARLLYGLIHQRWIVTSRGLAKMLEKYKKADFGRCPRVLCHSQPLLPCGLTDLPYEKPVKLYCPRCEDLYSPKSSRHGSIDGAYFGSTFPHMFLMVYPHMIPPKSPNELAGSASGAGTSGGGAGAGPRRPGVGPTANMTEDSLISSRNSMPLGVGNTSTATSALKAEKYRPKIFGFNVHEIAKLQRWQSAVRDRQISRLEAIDRGE
ncbi:casein kinase 2 regulatory subunit [Tulasnella sp. 419]|nr:casein kinase 2 regulatory subunit [Tulasnella sp. 419]